MERAQRIVKPAAAGPRLIAGVKDLPIVAETFAKGIDIRPGAAADRPKAVAAFEQARHAAQAGRGEIRGVHADRRALSRVHVLVSPERPARCVLSPFVRDGDRRVRCCDRDRFLRDVRRESQRARRGRHRAHDERHRCPQRPRVARDPSGLQADERAERSKDPGADFEPDADGFEYLTA
jgi:hypothetical protein